MSNTPSNYEARKKLDEERQRSIEMIYQILLKQMALALTTKNSILQVFPELSDYHSDFFAEVAKIQHVIETNIALSLDMPGYTVKMALKNFAEKYKCLLEMCEQKKSEQTEPITAQPSPAQPSTEAVTEIESVSIAAESVEPETAPAKQEEETPLTTYPQAQIISPTLFRLPNGRVGTDYCCELPLTGHYRAELGGDKVDGLQWRPESQTIVGIPLFAGEYRIMLIADHQSDPEIKLELTINPDPRTLWNNLPSDQTSHYWKPDCDSFSLFPEKYPDWQMLAASQRGRSHAHQGSCRDDDFIMRELPDGWLLLGVADGAGSARYSRRGSQLACESAYKWLNQSLQDPLLQAKFTDLLTEFQASGQQQPPHSLQTLCYEILPQAALVARKAIEQEALMRSETEAGISSKDFATTLLLCLCRKLQDQWFFCGFGIGDGAIAIYDHNQSQLHLLSEADSGEYSGQTRFLTMGSVWSEAGELFQRLKYLLVSDFSACLLLSDGISDPKFASEKAMQQAEAWHPLWQDLLPSLNSPEPQQALLEWLQFWSEGEHDDRTLALLTRRPHDH